MSGQNPCISARILFLRQQVIDFLEQPSLDLLAMVKGSKDVSVAPLWKRSGNQGVLRLNWTNPPFDNAAIRKAVQNFVITIPIEKRPGSFRYRATVDLPPIADGAGSLVHLDATVGKRYRLAGKQRSYVSARCGDGVLRTHGRFTFGDGTIIEGSIEKGCTVR